MPAKICAGTAGIYRGRAYGAEDLYDIEFEASDGEYVRVEVYPRDVVRILE